MIIRNFLVVNDLHLPSQNIIRANKSNCVVISNLIFPWSTLNYNFLQIKQYAIVFKSKKNNVLPLCFQ